MIVNELKNIIKYAIELDIDYIETFLGYEGDNVLKITTQKQEVSKLIEKYIENLDLEFKSEFDVSSGSYGQYNIYVGVEDPAVFKLKRDKKI